MTAGALTSPEPNDTMPLGGIDAPAGNLNAPPKSLPTTLLLDAIIKPLKSKALQVGLYNSTNSLPVTTKP